ncbi:MAG TPA: FhaA domain-containing protein [Anaerolineales bacterium]|nr:FhaA domain-containing protein [Anaerolineales bacterium]
MPSLDEFESRLQSLLEVHLLKYLPGYKVEDGIAQRLASVMHSHLREQNGETLAPNLYVVVSNPSNLIRWRFEPRLLQELAGALYTAGTEAGFKFLTRPTISTMSDPTMTSDEVRIIASFSGDSLTETQGRPVPEGKTEPIQEKIPGNAFLILNGTQVIPLNRSVMNIGRRLDNHVVIDDPRVSRAHAQLRVVRDRFVLFDLDSSGGTFVNGQRTNQSVLYPGDVISLAGVTLIFGQDLPGRSNNNGKTGPSSSFSSDRPTAILRKEDFFK